MKAVLTQRGGNKVQASLDSKFRKGKKRINKEMVISVFETK